MAKQKYFRVYSRGFVHFFTSEVSLGGWLISDGLMRGHITLSYEAICHSGKIESRSVYSKQSLRRMYEWQAYRSRAIKPARLRFEDVELRVEAPDGKVLGPEMLIECIRAAENQKQKEALTLWSYYSSGSKCNWHRGTTFRLIRTQNERRQNSACEDDEAAPKVRASRRNLPSYYDEVMRHKEDNWKSYRLMQYKKSYPSARMVSRAFGDDL